MEYLHVPLDSIVRSSHWLNSEIGLFISGNREFQAVCDAITAEWVHYTLDLVYFWQGKEFKCWEDDKWLQVNGFRYDVSESVEVAENLLLFQFGSEEAIKHFLQDVVSVFDRKNPKKSPLPFV
jgi:hypothetical protein